MSKPPNAVLKGVVTACWPHAITMLLLADAGNRVCSKIGGMLSRHTDPAWNHKLAPGTQDPACALTGMEGRSRQRLLPAGISGTQKSQCGAALHPASGLSDAW